MQGKNKHKRHANKRRIGLCDSILAQILQKKNFKLKKGGKHTQHNVKKTKDKRRAWITHGKHGFQKMDAV